MSYTHAILKANTVEILTKYVCDGEAGIDDDVIEYFSRAKTYDDIKIVLLFKYLFEFLDRIQKERTNVSSDKLFQLINFLEENNICHDIQCFDEKFIKYMVSKRYSDYTKGDGNLSNVVVELMKEYYNDAIAI